LQRIAACPIVNPVIAVDAAAAAVIAGAAIAIVVVIIIVIVAPATAVRLPIIYQWSLSLTR
jgi:high-affinity Fe2+/Pb2+ permease